MEQNNIPTDVQERIFQDADKYAFVVPYDGSNKFFNDDKLAGYIAGATAEAERAQKLVDALEWIRNFGPVGEITAKFIDKTLRESKDKKEVGNG